MTFLVVILIHLHYTCIFRKKSKTITKNVGIDKDSIFVEYWIDDDSFHYMFTLDNGDDIEVNDDF